ncbi:TetR/AcrR family transcriptional regulator C-terminal domain-containing protein [Companilactobacillus bobalius]|uniref:HTH tetR-type domain-containing protein n=2 Tax=Companilactobacillus bobalius TaxID=2801451 RepID=A0A202FEZ7_9LACO|nr:TetR/AcrR family transcriptional regulator C-terminal domain-containing protein [Companilactobacillus bobalius]KRK83254.1 Transcriptional regulator [Companilactobacillus bobalius DSM 19674]OVE99055.1 hypothetical protein LKACC16343_00167 [Companilactobacillus bobalius]GEO57030.1 TetR family transcriptional regulator [Companilactobacillus paralimentarius]
MESNEKRLKTEMKIQRAFIKIVSAEGFDKLAISALIKDAKINRGTFYIHYLDKYDLKSQYEKEIILDIQNIFSNYKKPSLDKSLNKNNAFLQLFKYLYRQKELSILLLKDYDSKFVKDIKNLVLSIASNATENDDKLPKNYANELLSQGILDFLIYWLEGTPVLKPQKIYDIFIYTRTLNPEQLSNRCK